MDIRYAANPNDVKRYTTEELRKEFLIENLYVPDTVVAVYSHVDRMVTLGCMPVKETVSIDKGIDIWANFGTHYFLERREIGIFNIGGAGKITVDGTVYELGYKDCLYITMGAKQDHRRRHGLRAWLQGLPLHHHGREGSPLLQRRRFQARQVLHGFRPRAPEL